MSAFGSKLRRLEGGRLAFWCPGCNEAHQVRVDGQGAPNWGYNGDPERPTLTPSVLVTTGHYVPGWGGGLCWCTPDPDGEAWDFQCSVCHLFLTEGQLQFLTDSTHALAGQTVPLPDFPHQEEQTP